MVFAAIGKAESLILTAECQVFDLDPYSDPNPDLWHGPLL